MHHGAMTTKPVPGPMPHVHAVDPGPGDACLPVSAEGCVPAPPEGTRARDVASDSVVLRPGDDLYDRIHAPLSPETMARIERLERSTARAAARAKDILLD